MQKLRIALMGTRGIPANYGGFETFYEELGKRLVIKGHDVTVYCRDSYYPSKMSSYCGMSLIYISNLKRKSLDTLSHTFLSILHAIRQPYDVLMFCNAANSPILLLPRLLGKRIAINTDGLEWKRGKWGTVAKLYYKLSERIACLLADRVIADSRGIQAYYQAEYNAETTFIPYGAYPAVSVNPQAIKALGLCPNGYFLQITRFEPENNPLLTIKAFKQLQTDKKLVVIGGVPYKSEYLQQIKQEAEGHPNIILPGSIYDKGLLNEIWCNCFAYVHGNEVGGTNPALLQTMANGCFTIAIDVSFSKDVLGECGIFYQKTKQDLTEKMLWSLSHCHELEPFKIAARERILEWYSWDSVVDDYERMFLEITSKH